MELYVKLSTPYERVLMCRNVDQFSPVISLYDFSAAMVALTKSMCWKVVSKTMVSRGVGLVVYQKPVSPSCYKELRKNAPPMCDVERKMSWYCL